MKPEFAEALKALADAAEADTLLSVAWVRDKGGAKRQFGHVGYTDGREVLTDSLITLRSGLVAGANEVN